MFVPPEYSCNLGVVRYMSSSNSDVLSTGDKVYFGNKYDRLKMEDKEILVMESDNVYATVEEEETKENVSTATKPA